MRIVGFVLMFCCAFAVFGMEIRTFDSPEQQARYEDLIKELRCLVCQNQSLADSDADLAKDLRNEVYDIIQSGKSEEEAVRFLTDRYGDFVLYRPKLKSETLLLWGGPLLILLSGLAFLWWQNRKQRDLGQVLLSPEERQRLNRLRNNIEG